MPRQTWPVWTLALLCGFGTGLAAQAGDWAPEDRAVIGDFTQINAVTTTTERVYVVSRDAVVGYDPQTGRWEGPWRPLDPTLLRDVLVALADPLDNSLWLVRRNGWVRFEPAIRMWETGFVPGSVVDAALDQNAPASGLFLRTGSGWFIAGRGGMALPGAAPQQPVRAATVDDAVRDNPAIQASSAGLLFSSRFRNVRYTSAARASGFTGQGWYLGTNGAGLVFFPLASGIPQTLTFGLPGSAVAAIFGGTGGVWAVTERTVSADPSLSFVGTEFGEFRWYQGPRATGLPFARARRVVGMGSSLWIASDAGAIRITPRDEQVDRYGEGRGLPDQRVLDLAQRQGKLVPATAHGLAVFQASGGFQPLVPSFTDPASAVELSGDTVWVGTALGLFAAVPGETDLLQPDALAEGLSLRAAVLDLAWRADTLVALTADRLLWRDPGSGRYKLGPALGGGLGRMHTVINSARGLFVAGERGVGFVTLATPVSRALREPADLPGRVTGLAVDDEYLWVATLDGLVRFRLELVGR